jgi:uncharacterized membrane protein
VDRTNLTYYCERWRAVASGVLETAGGTFLLLIAVRYFAAGPLPKAFIAASTSAGLLISPIVVSLVAHSGLTASKAASRLAAGGAICFLLVAVLPSLPVFVMGSIAAMAASTAAVPLVTQIYQDNYPELDRGRRFARTVMIRIAIAAAFSQLAGRILSVNSSYPSWLLATFSAAFVLASGCFARCPSRPLPTDGGSHPFRALRFVRSDRLFRQTLLCWMLLGFANLMMLPLRIEYLANAKYGVTLHGATLNAGMIALLTGVVPNLARLALSPVWGWLFDRMNFFVLRMTLNIGFALGILTFFTSRDLPGLIVAAVFYGISMAGGDVAWSLWVTKFSPPDRVANYMSVHTCLTGVRGVLAPLTAFHLVSHFSMITVGCLSAGLIGVATLLLLPEVKLGRGVRPAAALVEEITE